MSKSTFIVAVTAILLLNVPAGAQEIVQPAQPGVFAGITSRGHGTVKAKPDIAYATVSVVTQSRDQAQAISDNSAAIKNVRAALAESKVADKDVQTQFYTVQPQYDYRMTPPVLSGYQVTNSLRVTFRDIAKIGVILDKTTRAGATQVGDVSFDLSDRQRYEGDALALAVADARSKADLMAGAAGVEIGHLLSLSEGSGPQTQPIPLFRAMATSASAPSTPTDIQPQIIQVDADATAVYTIVGKRE